MFFSLLAVLIIIGLYAAFLGNTLTSGLEGVSGARFLMDSWIMAGLLAVASITTTLSAAGVIVDDKAKGIAKDLRCAPLSAAPLWGYLLATVVGGDRLKCAGFVRGDLYFAKAGSCSPWERP